MAQFEVFHNPNPQTKKAYPYLLDVQSPILDSLETRLIIPLSVLPGLREKKIKELNPSMMINGKEVIVATQQMAAIHKKDIGSFVCEATNFRQQIISAIDFLITGF